MRTTKAPTSDALRDNFAMRLWTYKRPFHIDDIEGSVHTQVTLREMSSTLFVNGVAVETDRFVPRHGQPLRNNHLRHALPDGRMLDIEAGYVGWWKIQIAVRVNGVLRFESSPGAKIQWPTSVGKTLAKDATLSAEDVERNRIETERQREQFRRNKPSLFFDIGMALLFFVVAKYTNLTTAALVSAAAGIVGAIVQRITKIDLLGGLATFGIVMSLITAGFALAFQDDDMVKMRSTILGVFTAFLFLGDGLFGGRFLGKRLVRYMPHPETHAGRLSIGIGCVGIVMAVLNYGVAKVFSTDAWLFYATFLDTVLALVLTFAAIKYATPKSA
jgi:intracellular septation protein A